MGSKIVAFTCIVFFLSRIIVFTAGEVTLSTIIKSLKDTQELLDAYNDRDYVMVGIKLIDIKLKADPPEKNSREEQILLFLREQLVDIYPYYRQIVDGMNRKPTLDDIRNLEYEKIIEHAINTMDVMLYQTGVGIDNLQHYGTFIKQLENESDGETANILGKIIEGEYNDNAGEQLSNILNNFANIATSMVDQFADVVAQAAKMS